MIPQLTIGAYGSYGIGKVGAALMPASDRGTTSECGPGWSCSARVINAGVQATWRFQLASVSPWAGVGVGYEWADASIRGFGANFELKARGFELARVMVGVDFRVGAAFALGPYLQWGMGRYHHLETTWVNPSYHGSSGTISGQPSSEAMHSWYTVGLRGSFESLGDGASSRAGGASPS